VSIIGGGLAGLTLGIALRQRDVPVTVWEAGHYPRHRVCGEFICGRGRATLAALGLNPRLADAGAREANTALFLAGEAAGPVRELPEPALCLARFALDDALAQHFRSLGGALREGERRIETRLDDGVVQATGRRPQTAPAGWRWFGLKAHARGVELAADLEVHLAPNGYTGLCQLADGIVNVCGLFRRRGEADAPLSRIELLRGAPGSLLHQRLGKAKFLPESVCAVGGLDLRPRVAGNTTECRIGDALTMIPPFTGNGMSMAIEAAAVAADPLERWSRHEASWAETRESIALGCDALFGPRLSWARRLHGAMFLGPLQPALVHWLPRAGGVWDFLFSRTR
jgi:2-polyprenyl-6-methoxyphenol hydroxylase-like FAD-dependent oxidoreductase